MQDNLVWQSQNTINLKAVVYGVIHYIHVTDVMSSNRKSEVLSEDENRDEKKDVAKIVVLTAVWWIGSSVFSASSKNALLATDLEYVPIIVGVSFVTFIQLFIAAMLSLAFLAAKGQVEKCFNILRPCIKIGVLHGIGNQATNFLVVTAGVSGALTYKAAEPLFVMLVLRVLAPQRFSQEATTLGLSFMGLVCIGVAIASYHPPFVYTVLLAAAACNLMFGARTVYIKELRSSQQNEGMYSMINIFFMTCIIGCLVTGVFSFMVFIALDSGAQMAAVSAACSKSALVSSLFYFVYNLVSFLALDLVSTPTHTLLKSGKGLTVLVMAGFFLKEEYSVLQWFGLYVAMLGVTLFSHSKSTSSTEIGAYVREAGFRVLALSLTTVTFFAVSRFLDQADMSTITGMDASTVYVEPESSLLSPGGVDNMAGKQYKPESSYLTPYERRGDAAAWLTCLGAIQELQYDLLEDIFQIKEVRDNRVLYLDPAHHTNFGDNALAEGVHQFLGRMGYGSSTTTQCRLHQASNVLPNCKEVNLDNHFLAVWHPGGNFGDLWYTNQVKRIESFEYLLARNMTVVSFPQSYEYGNKETEKSDALKLQGYIEKTVGLERAKEKVILLWRSQRSLDKASQAFPFVQHRLVPDMAFALRPMLPRRKFLGGPKEQVDILFIWRTDKEGLNRKQRNSNWVNDALSTMEGGESITFKIVDWPDTNKFAPASGSGHIKNACDKDFERTFSSNQALISHGKVVISDRLHGTIVSLLHRIPHIALENTYGKVRATRDAAFAAHEACRDDDAMNYRYTDDMLEAMRLAIHFLKYNEFPAVV